MKYPSLILIATLTACASATQVKGPNGEAAYLVKCGKAVQSKCTAKANDLCPGGYRVLERKSDAYNDSSKVGNVGALEVRADTTTTMLVQCK